MENMKKLVKTLSHDVNKTGNSVSVNSTTARVSIKTQGDMLNESFKSFGIKVLILKIILKLPIIPHIE